MSAAGNNRIDTLSQQARAATAAGRQDDAARLWEQVLAAAPNDAQALMQLGQLAFFRKDVVTARTLLERAVKAAPNDPAAPFNLSFVLRAVADAAGEMSALTKALAIDPYFYPALLSKAMLLERMGKQRQAAKAYKDVLSVAPPDDQASPAIKTSLDHAREVVQENTNALDDYLERRLREARARHADENLDRFEQSKNAATGAAKIYMQQPSLLNFPAVPAIQFYDSDLLPWIKDLEAATGVIRDEFLAVHRARHEDIRPYIQRAPGDPLNQWAELNNSSRWSTFSLWEDGKRIDEHCARCPRTTALLETLPMARIENFSPAVVFSLLAPWTRIPPHTGSTNARLIAHLPLIVPGDCRFRVGNETRRWEEGKAWVFDDTIEHEAWNDTDQLRVILMLDIWNPYLTPAEQDLVGTLLNGLAEYYKD